LSVSYDSVRFRLDSSTGEQVVAVTDQGAELQTYWADSFHIDPESPAIVDPDGVVVVVDAQVLPIPDQDWPRLNGNFVCPTEDALYVFHGDPG
jgi:hypothetical protein